MTGTTPQPGFTPGEWSVDWAEVGSVDECGRERTTHWINAKHEDGGGLVASVSAWLGPLKDDYDCGERVAGEARCNAHLISAAPDLYAALKSIISADRALGLGLTDSQRDASQSALARAEGRAV